MLLFKVWEVHILVEDSMLALVMAGMILLKVEKVQMLVEDSLQACHGRYAPLQGGGCQL